ncbi:O-antigen polymerase [Desulfosporosinus sp. FKA]|uniref:O-antigen polymerase n=1 Tax=Desulfosporosinus sp. FKA TaxID=1969834 RepID=UPI000B4A36FF|nr:O-antigen polymerase [Desulfosporosinus sp. FKA]
MNIVLFVIFVLCIIFTPKKYKKITNPVFTFTFMWAMIMEMAREQVYGLYSYSPEVMQIIVIGIVFFVLGYVIAYLMRKYTFKFKRKEHREITYRLRYNLLYILAIICMIYYLRYFMQSILLILQGNNLEVIRRLVQDETSSSPLNDLIINFVILPSATALEVLAVSDFWLGKRDKKLFIMSIIIIIMRIISDAGRTPMVDFSIYMIIGFLLTHNRKNEKTQKKRWTDLKDRRLARKYGTLGVIILFIMSISRTSSTLLRQVYFYYAMSPVMFTTWKEQVDAKGLITYGITSLNGYFFSVVYLLKNMFHLSYPDLLKTSYDMIALTDSSWSAIAQGNIRANAYVSAFWFFYTDGRIIGVALGMFIYGLIVSRAFFKAVNKLDLKKISIYLILYQGIFFSFIRFPFAKPYYALGVLIILLIAFKPVIIRKSLLNDTGR